MHKIFNGKLTTDEQARAALLEVVLPEFYRSPDKVNFVLVKDDELSRVWVAKCVTPGPYSDEVLYLIVCSCLDTFTVDSVRGFHFKLVRDSGLVSTTA